MLVLICYPVGMVNIPELQKIGSYEATKLRRSRSSGGLQRESDSPGEVVE